jgi:tetratricopeptide (TPR) repeat protein
MSLTLLGWLLIAASIAISALLIFLLRSRGSQEEQRGPEISEARLEPGSVNEAAADATRLGLLSRLRSSIWGGGQDGRVPAGTLTVAAAVFLLVAGIGAATSYLRNPSKATGSGDTITFPLSPSGSNGDVLARLKEYTRGVGIEEPASVAAAGKLLPDVNTMIERLLARLETTPEDIKGWRMLGWSYFHTGHYERAATAYAKAVELDPNSAELKLSLDEAKAKASETDSSKTASSLQTEAVGRGGDGPRVGTMTKSEAMPPHERGAEIRSMVDGLADRLEISPRDVEGWTRLMRSRVVLGEREVAATAFRKALEVFKDDSAASGMITAAAVELGLKAE